MHLAEGVLSARESVAWSLFVLPWVWRGWKQHRVSYSQSPASQKAAEALAGVLLFACSGMPIPLPFLGFSIHLCLTPLLSLLFDFKRIPFYVAIFLVIQALCTGHGGLSTWGINVFSLGILGPFVTVGFGRSTVSPAWVAFRCGMAVSLIYLFDAVILGAQMHSVQSIACWRWIAGIFVVLFPLVALEGALSGLWWSRLVSQNGAAVYRRYSDTRLRWGYLDWGLLIMACLLTYVSFLGPSLPDLDDFFVEQAHIFRQDLAVIGAWFLLGLCVGFAVLLNRRRIS